MRYVLDYTEKPYRGIKFKLFKTKKQMESFVKRNKKKLYWTRARHINPRSTKPIHIIKFDPSPETYTKMTGILTMHFETGFEQTALVFVDSEKNGYDAIHYLRDGDLVTIGNETYALINDIKFAFRDGHRFSFYPQGFTLKNLLQIFDGIKVTYYKRTPR